MCPVENRNHTPAAAAPIPEGSTIGGKYRLDALIAEGGMGLVYKGWHLVLDHAVAVKVVRPELAHREDAVSRFLNEARAVAQLRGEHIARVLDSGCIKDGPPYMVLEYLEGADLRTVLEGSGPLSVQRAIDLVLQTSEALAEAHAAGIVHRDIKPENLFLTRQPDGTECIKVLDFGISKRLGVDSRRSYTQEGQSLGSPHYMAPEQMSAPGQVDARADVWSLGVVLFELISGHVPFDGETVPIVCAQVLCQEPLSLRAVRPDVPEGLELAIRRCLEKQPDARYGSIGELAAAIAPFASLASADSLLRIQRLLGVEVKVRPLDLVRPLAERTSPPRVHTTTGGDFRLPKRRRWPALVGLAVAAAAGLAITHAGNVRELTSTAVASVAAATGNVRAFAEQRIAALQPASQTEVAPVPSQASSLERPPLEPTAAVAVAATAAAEAVVQDVTSATEPALSEPSRPVSSVVRAARDDRPVRPRASSQWIVRPKPATPVEPAEVDELIPPYEDAPPSPENETVAPESSSMGAASTTQASLRYAIDPASLRAVGLHSGPSAE